MHDELFKQPAVVARYRAGPYAEARERFLKQARAEGYSFSTLERIAWVLLTVAEAVHLHGGSVSSTRLKSLLFRHIRLSKGRPPSEHTTSLMCRKSKLFSRVELTLPPWR